MEPRIGVFGGTFNPVHIGHQVVAQDALEQFELDRVLYVPCANPPHKTPENIAPARHRLSMLEQAIEDDPRFEVSDIEIRRPGISYTIDTIRTLRAQYPGSDLFFIIGSDTLSELHSWKDVEELLAVCQFITFARPGYDPDEITEGRIHLAEPWPARLKANVTTNHMVEISSSEIRMRVAEGMSIRYLVPPAVEMYIAEHSLYRL